jgi:hypothetical protein
MHTNKLATNQTLHLSFKNKRLKNCTYSYEVWKAGMS